ncbi:MAG: protease inhibitor I42 family protein [Terracidiphilus sp.]
MCRLFLSVLLAILCLPNSVYAATKVVTDEDKGNDIQLKVGDVLEVRLKSNPSTGTRWYVHPKSTTLLKLGSETEIPGTEPGADRPMLQVFTFEVKRKGDGILLMRYAPANQKPMLGEEERTFHVVVE